MKGIISIAILLMFNQYISAQKYSKEDISKYLSGVATGGLVNSSDTVGNIQVTIESHGMKVYFHYCWENNVDITFRETGTPCDVLSFDLGDVDDINISEEEDYNDKRYALKLTCDDGSLDCVKYAQDEIIGYYSNDLHDDPTITSLFDYVNIIYLKDFQSADVLLNGIKYLFYLETNITEDKLSNQAFSSVNLTTHLSQNTKIIPLEDGGGVSIIYPKFYDSKLPCILDSGASDVSIPAKLEQYLLESNFISDSDYLSSQNYRIADGSIVMSRRFIIPYIIIDDIKVKEVLCSVNQSEEMILIGKSFLNKFNSWSLDNSKNQLILKY